MNLSTDSPRERRLSFRSPAKRWATLACLLGTVVCALPGRAAGIDLRRVSVPAFQGPFIAAAWGDYDGDGRPDVGRDPVRDGRWGKTPYPEKQCRDGGTARGGRGNPWDRRSDDLGGLGITPRQFVVCH